VLGLPLQASFVVRYSTRFRKKYKARRQTSLCGNDFAKQGNPVINSKTGTTTESNSSYPGVELVAVMMVVD
jgi:hypothetical protein